MICWRYGKERSGDSCGQRSTEHRGAVWAAGGPAGGGGYGPGGLPGGGGIRREIRLRRVPLLYRGGAGGDPADPPVPLVRPDGAGQPLLGV